MFTLFIKISVSHGREIDREREREYATMFTLFIKISVSHGREIDRERESMRPCSPYSLRFQYHMEEK